MYKLVRMASSINEDSYIYDLKDNIQSKITIMGDGIPFHMKIMSEGRKPPLIIFFKYPNDSMSKINLEIYGSFTQKEPNCYDF